MNAAFFDIFGMLAFLFVIVVSSIALAKKKKLPKWTLIILLAIGIIGFIVDALLVYINYIT